MSNTPKPFVQSANEPVGATVFFVWFRRGSFIGPGRYVVGASG